ncbi:MAG: hypothetical protein ISR76_05530 [Planctomycetes bacterium]|nr:hypothetical protein [Planctomycetota bacterium]MBL7008438.1 hypothetical protein [Planctomycetota bacterium]
MIRSFRPIHAGAILLATTTAASLALTVPNEIQMPGTQPGEVGSYVAASNCDNCHGGFDPVSEPAHNWHGSMMAQAGRDPLFWATMAISEQDFDGSGDLCLRCHTPIAWLEGRSTPTDGSALTSADADGVECHFCHRMVDPDGSEYTGVQNPPFLAHDEGATPRAYYGNGMTVQWGGSERFGPYADSTARHSALPSAFHRSSDFCGSCHDVSNPLVGDLAHNNGAVNPLPPGSFSGVPGDPVDTKAAFNNFPHLYGVVERTYSEHMASAFPGLAMADYPALPPALRQGSIQRARDAAVAGTGSGDFEDGSTRYFTCQSCHMRPVSGKGAKQNNARVRPDLAVHDLVGGNYWGPQAVEYLDSQGRLPLGDPLSAAQKAGLAAGELRARSELRNAAALELDASLLRVVNLTGHKLPTGYPEGRRMWLNVRWYGLSGEFLLEDGAYGDLAVSLQGQPTTVRTLLQPDHPRTTVWEARYGITQEWAAQLIAVGLPASLPVAFDRVSGAVIKTLGQVANQPAGTAYKNFHFPLLNLVMEDGRIPPFGFDFDEAGLRNVRPVPEDRFGAPQAGQQYRYWDEVPLDPPPGAVRAEIRLLYQPTSWEFVQFLYLANDGSVARLAQSGQDLLDAWLATDMAEPEVMAETTWTKPRIAWQ